MSHADDDSQAPTADLRSFGRRRGRKLSPRQQRLIEAALPRKRVDLSAAAPTADGLASLFAQLGGTPREVWLEIGFGGAEHLIWQAGHNPGIGLIGAEPFEEGVVKALAAIEDHSLGNVLIHPDDARGLLRWLPAASIARAFILFPDPWPKRKHVKRRLISPALLALLARVMKPAAELRIATDIGDYARTLMISVRQEGSFGWTAREAADWRSRPADWPATRYEAKAMREGRTAYFFTFHRRSRQFPGT